MSRTSPADPARLGRGPLTRWLPVLWQASTSAPALGPFEVPAGTKPSRFLLRALFSVKRLTVPATLLAILWQVGEALVPVIAGAAIDRSLATGDSAQLMLWLAVLGANFLLLSLAFRFAAQLTARATEVAQHRLRATLSARILHPVNSSGHKPEGTVVSLMTNDVARIGMLGLTVYPVGELAGVLFIAVSLLVIHWPLGLTVLIGAPIVVWLMGLFSGQYARVSRSYQTQLAQTVGRATDLVTGYRVIKGVRAEAEATRRYRQASQETRDGAYRMVGALGRFLTGSDILSGVFIAGVAGLAGWFAITGTLSVGGLITSVGLTQALLPPMRMLTGNAVPLGAAAIASSSRVLNALSGSTDHGPSPETDQSSQQQPFSGTADHTGAVPTLEVSATGQPSTLRASLGELLGVRADDVTAARLVQAMLHPYQDNGLTVHIDHTPASQLPNLNYRSQVVVAPHHGTLFTGTIAENLNGLVPPSPEPAIDPAIQTSPRTHPLEATAVHHAIQAASCEDFLATAGGAQAQVGEMGNRLSGGQRQRLALARALATEAPVLVLHDPTTAVDPVTEERIASRLPEVRLGRSTLIITSSPALLAACDRVIDLHQNSEDQAL